VSDAELNLRLATLLGLDVTHQDDQILVDGEPFDPVNVKRQCDPLMISHDVELAWAEGVWSAQTTAPGGRPVTIEDESATRAVVLAILAAHEQE
jgi:hypothetical protein